MLADDPCAGVDLPPVTRREIEALSVEECRRFLTAARESSQFALFALAADHRNEAERIPCAEVERYRLCSAVLQASATRFRCRVQPGNSTIRNASVVGPAGVFGNDTEYW